MADGEIGHRRLQHGLEGGPARRQYGHRFEKQITALEPFLGENWKARVSAKSGNPVYERPVILVIYRNDHRFLLDQIVPKPGGTVADYDLVIASQPYRARASLEFKAKRVLAPLARALGPGGRMIAIHSYGHDPGMEIIHKVWPSDNPFTTAATTCSRQSSTSWARPAAI